MQGRQERLVTPALLDFLNDCVYNLQDAIPAVHPRNRIHLMLSTAKKNLEG